MKNLTQTAVDLAEIIETINLIADKDIINFDSEDKVIRMLRDTYLAIKDIDIMEFFGEVWSKTTYPNRADQAESVLNNKFRYLLGWKNDIDDIKILRTALQNDCIKFYERGKCSGNAISSIGLNNMIISYDQIGVKLLGLKRDYKRLMDKIRQKAEEEKEGEEAQSPLNRSYTKFRLNPDKINQFIDEIICLYKKDFFLAVSEETEIREEDILLGFQKILDTDLMS